MLGHNVFLIFEWSTLKVSQFRLEWCIEYGRKFVRPLWKQIIVDVSFERSRFFSQVLPFLHQVIKNLFHITSDIRIGVFIDGKSTRGVLHEKIQQSCRRKRFRKMFQNFTGHQMAASRFRGEMKCGLSDYEYSVRLIPVLRQFLML